MKTFKELYEKRRTRINSSDIWQERNVEYIPDSDYIKNDNGNIIKYKTLDGLELTCLKSQWNKFLSVMCKDGEYRAEYLTTSILDVQYFSAIPYSGDKKVRVEKYTVKQETIIRDKNIVGTSLAVFTSIWELCLTSKFIWTWFIGIIHDGYWMTLTAPFAWLFWVLASIVYLPLFLILSGLIVVSVIWTYTFELTGSIVNQEHPYIPNPF